MLRQMCQRRRMASSKKSARVEASSINGLRRVGKAGYDIKQ
jgi:hypothetical protein